MPRMDQYQAATIRTLNYLSLATCPRHLSSYCVSIPTLEHDRRLARCRAKALSMLMTETFNFRRDSK
jgi:hypothetical protein